MGLKVSEGTFAREQMLQQYSPEDQAYLRANPDIRPEEVGMRPVKDFTSNIDPFNTRLNIDEISSTLDELSGERQDLEARFDTENVQRPKDVDVDEITSLLNDIQPPLVNLDITEEDTKLGVETKFEGLSPDELKTEIANMNIPDADALINEELLPAQNQEDLIASVAAEKDEKGDPNIARNATQKKLNTPGFFGTDRFLDFIRNVGAGLSETGQFGPGLVLGAAKAAEERAARDIAEAERQREIELATIAAGVKEKLKPKENIDLAGQVNADYNEVVSANNTLEIVGRVEEIILNEDTTSAKAVIQEIFDKAGAVFNTDGQPDPEGKGWNELSPRVRAKVLLNQIKQKNIRDILGESGKTISNLDRQIVDELVGSLQFFKTDAEALEALRLTREGILTNMSGAIARLKSNYIGMENYGDMSLIQNDDLIDYMETGQLAGNPYANDFVGSTKTRPGRINKITLNPNATTTGD